MDLEQQDAAILLYLRNLIIVKSNVDPSKILRKAIQFLLNSVLFIKLLIAETFNI